MWGEQQAFGGGGRCGEQWIVGSWRFSGKNIDRRGTEFAGGELCHQRSFINDAAARRIDEDCIGFHQSETLCIEQVLRRW